jgi:hypothetical protein
MFWRKRKRESWSMSMSMREEKGVELYIVGGEWNMRRVFCQCMNQKIETMNDKEGKSDMYAEKFRGWRQSYSSYLKSVRRSFLIYLFGGKVIPKLGKAGRKTTGTRYMYRIPVRV